MCPASRLFDSASPGRPCCLAKAKVRPKHIAGFLVPRPRMRPQWTRQTTGLHGPASTDTPASDTPRSAPSGLSARDRRRCREQRWDKPGIDESHRQAGLVSVWWDRAGMGRERKAERPTDGGLSTLGGGIPIAAGTSLEPESGGFALAAGLPKSGFPEPIKGLHAARQFWLSFWIRHLRRRPSPSLSKNYRNPGSSPPIAATDAGRNTAAHHAIRKHKQESRPSIAGGGFIAVARIML